MKKYELAEKENVRLKRASEEAMSEKNRAIADRNSFKQQLNSMMKKRDSVLVERDVAVQNWNQVSRMCGVICSDVLITYSLWLFNYYE